MCPGSHSSPHLTQVCHSPHVPGSALFFPLPLPLCPLPHSGDGGLQGMSGPRVAPLLPPVAPRGGRLRLSIPSLPPVPSFPPPSLTAFLPPSLLPAAAAAVSCQGNHSWLGGSPLFPIPPSSPFSSPPPHPPLFFPARLGGAGTKPENGGGAEGSWEGDGGRGPTPAVHLGCFSPPEAPSPLLRRRPKAAWRSQRCGQRGQPHFNTQNKLIHSRGRQ